MLGRIALITLCEGWGDISRGQASDAWRLFRDLGEDSPETLSECLDAIGADGSLAFDVWGEW